jgi:hypothetical protein
MRVDDDRRREFAEDFAISEPEEGSDAPVAARETRRRPDEPLRRRSVSSSHPELRKAAVVSALDRAVKAVRENDESMALIHMGVAQKLLENAR